MIAELLMFAVALGLFGLYYTFSFMKKAVFPKGLRQAIRRVLNIKRADELPPPYGRNYGEMNICKFSFPSKVSQCSMNHLDLSIAMFIFQMFALVFTLRSSLHVGERTVRHARAELMREQQTTTHTLTNTLNTLSLTVRAQMLQIRGLKVLENTQMFCIIEFHFIDLSLRIFNTNLYYCGPKACNGFGNGV
jgi:hypothetical protein